MDTRIGPPPPVALCLGGMDPSGGAGLLRDALTLSALGVHPMAISTAETLQNGSCCERIEAPSMDPGERLDALRGHLRGNWGLKLGMCALALPQVKALAAQIDDLAPPVRIWDPILAPSAGPGLHDRAALLALAEVLLPGEKWVVCPNRVEAATAAGLDPEADPRELAQPFFDRGARAVWLKGGHCAGNIIQDIWMTAKETQNMEASPRLSGARRGTGCTLASAWLGYRLLGSTDLAATLQACQWLRGGWKAAFAPGGFGRPLFAPKGAS